MYPSLGTPVLTDALADSISVKIVDFYCVWSESKSLPDLCSFHVIGRDLCWWTTTLTMHKSTEELKDTKILENVYVRGNAHLRVCSANEV